MLRSLFGPKRVKVIEGCKKLNNVICTLPNIRFMELRRMGRHATCIKMKSIYYHLPDDGESKHL
jgi:hypothetical protein